MKRSHKKFNSQTNGEWAHHVRRERKRLTHKKIRQQDRQDYLEQLEEASV